MRQHSGCGCPLHARVIRKTLDTVRAGLGGSRDGGLGLQHQRRTQVERRWRTRRDRQRVPDVVGARPRQLAVLSDVRFWHGADIKLRPLFSRYGVESGHHRLVMSISAFDQTAT
jgi:hypothetical protein